MSVPKPRPLHDGLDTHERLVRLEVRMFGTERVRGLEYAVERLQSRVEELESDKRRRDMGWFSRLMLRVTTMETLWQGGAAGGLGTVMRHTLGFQLRTLDITPRVVLA